MDPEQDNESAGESEEDGSFARVTAVATGWTVDFLFLRMCRSFKKADLEEFNEGLDTFEAICQNPSLKAGLDDEKVMIVAFLSRVMHGKQLDVQFDEDDSVTPLMSAAKMWSNLKATVADTRLFNNVTILLLAQTVAVCLERGQRSSASSALKWFESNNEFPQNVRVKLTTIVTQKETYHPFLMSFSFKRLLETIQSYLDAYLERNPCDYLLKEATKVVQSSQNGNVLEDVVKENCCLSRQNEKKMTRCLIKKRQLLPTKIADLWKPDTCKKPYVSVRRLSKTELSQKTNRSTSQVSQTQRTRKKWTSTLDKYLKAGVERHGPGKWAQILKDYDFEGRTGTMLKDRWRVLLRAHEVG
ncbi:telomeric repeat-binding factor 1 [Betta splendens]|uniref:Telomeric repeat-binding factor n=1 Tax=Betta splendens TaxID=158456 RepID=A0A6P7MET5_BETSP|nr:telomeric repeat-binding factor 1 [Betta splendens]